MAEVLRAGQAAEVAFLSFSRKALVRCRKHAPEVPRGHIFYRATAEEILAGAAEAATDLVMPEKGMLTGELMARLQAARLRVATWVVDEPEELRALRPYGLFGVGSNRPGVLIVCPRGLDGIGDLPLS